MIRRAHLTVLAPIALIGVASVVPGHTLPDIGRIIIRSPIVLWQSILAPPRTPDIPPSTGAQIDANQTRNERAKTVKDDEADVKDLDRKDTLRNDRTSTVRDGEAGEKDVDEQDEQEDVTGHDEEDEEDDLARNCDKDESEDDLAGSCDDDEAENGDP